MRLRAVTTGLLLVLPLIGLAACAPASQSGQSSGATESSAAASESAAASSSAPATAGPEIPADTTVAAPVDRTLMPTASGSFGDKPTISMPSTPPPSTLQRVVLSEGDGPVVKSHDWLQVNYLGQVWGGKVFDNSYDRGSLFSFQVDASPQQVVAGWDYGLRGVKQGSRVMLSFPPQDGYGSAGNPPDISGADTLVFVVDVVKVIDSHVGGQSDATPQSVPDGLPVVKGDLGKEPTITVPSGLAQPTADKTVLLAKGTGAPAQAGDVLVQYVASTWDGSQTEKSWPDDTGAGATAGTGPRSLPLTSDSPFAGLIGLPIGSRVMLLMAADNSTGNPALAWVIDLVLQTDVTPATSGSAAASATNPPPTAPTS